MNTPFPGDLDLYGVFVPTPLLLIVAAYALKALVRTGLARIGFYGHIWHPGLFNVALYLTLLGSLLVLLPGARL